MLFLVCLKSAQSNIILQIGALAVELELTSFFICILIVGANVIVRKITLKLVAVV